MPIPDLDSNGLLPAGRHDCTLDEIGERFGSFQGTSRRVDLFRKLEEFVKEAKSTGLFVAILIDGSFVTDNPDPGDIDLILVVPPDHDFDAVLRPFEYNLVSKRQVRKQFRFDAFTAADGSPELEAFLRFFGRVREHFDWRKGLLRVML